MAKSKEDWEEEQEEKEQAWSDEELAAIPKSPKRFEVWVEDRYVITEVEPGLKQKVKDNNWCCLSGNGERCMCKDFYTRDGEGPCKCGIYKKTLRDEKSFLKMRRATFKRGE